VNGGHFILVVTLAKIAECVQSNSHSSSQHRLTFSTFIAVQIFGIPAKISVSLTLQKEKLRWRLIYVLRGWLTPWSRVVPEKRTGSNLPKKFPAFYGRRRLITAFTRARHVFLSQFVPVHPPPPPPTTPHPTSRRSTSEGDTSLTICGRITVNCDPQL
jgi:hypothetical protein